MSFDPLNMEDSLRKAACQGNVPDLYALIQEDGNFLKRIDEVEFIDTPLHVAADAGCIEFAMEMMSLKPSFARKLNPQGLTPLHLAVEKGHKELLLLLLQKAKDLVRVAGKKGETPLHHLITGEENFQIELLPVFLKVCPESIRDMTNENQTPLHIAVKNNKKEALKILCKMLRKTDYCEDIVNQKDRNGDTALHIAARDNRHQMIKLLLKCKADKHVTNQADATVLDVAQHHNNRESIITLRGCPNIPTVSTFIYKLQKQYAKYVTKATSTIFYDMDNISSEDRNALLVIIGLLLTATFQASLSPPGSVWQENNEGKVVGKSVMDQGSFLFFYIPAAAVFIVTFFLTLGLLKPFPRGFKTALQILLAFLAICFYEAVLFLAPTDLAFIIINLFSILVFALLMLMCITYRVSKVSVLILGCFLLPMGNRFTYSIGNFFVGCLSFLLLYDEFWKGSVLVIGFSLFTAFSYQDLIIEPSIVLGGWFFLSLCRFCIKRLNEHCSAEQSTTVRTVSPSDGVRATAIS